MSNPGDFFAFSISLSRIQLKAIGELSEVKHIAGGETIYSAGDESDALYIISRGMAEILPEESGSATFATYLSRGDIFGDVELLSGLPRTHSVRSCDGVSLRVFQHADLDELTRRVPSFFRYLSERLATRLLHARDLAVAGSHCRELSGSLSQFDLVAIYQTITHSSQTGQLSIRDEQGKELAAFWFDGGRPRSARFQHLSGEEAFVQLFLAHDLRGTFSFDSAAPIPTLDDADGFTPDAHELLIRAMQTRDEFAEVKRQFPDTSACFRQAASQLYLDEISEDMVGLAQKLWKLSLGRAISIEAIYRQSDVCELKIYRAVSELLRTGQFEIAPAVSNRKVA